jgi:hypothetical protein
MLKVACPILTIVALCAVLIGAVYVARGGLMPYHVAFIGEEATEAITNNPGLTTLARVFVRLTGTLFLSAGILLLAVIYYGLRRAERWAWWATLIGMGVVTGPTAAITRPIGGFPATLAIILLVLFVAGIALAAMGIFRVAPAGSALRT